MAIKTWDELYEQTMQHYGAERFSEAYDLLTQEGPRFPEREVIALYLRSCLAARTGQSDHALDLLEESLGKGYWYGEPVMRQSPSWGVLQGVPRFEEMAKVCAQRAEESRSEPQVFYAEPQAGCSEDAPCPLILALHGNTDYAERALDGWAVVTRHGWLLAALQSSQAMVSGMYIWDDQEIALREVGEHYASTRERYSIDEENLVLAGFSMGGDTALRAALTGTVPVRGFILLGPGGPTIDNPSEWLPLLEGREHKVRGYVLLGEEDQAIQSESVLALVGLLNERGIPCKLETIPGLVHDYPRNSPEYIERALSFIAPRQAT